jgi:Caspase domain
LNKLNTGALVGTAGSEQPHFFALIIGINEYVSDDIYNLKGAVPDALDIKKYLEKYLGVPESQIRLLLDEEATRSAIIQEFVSLMADERIHRGDPILIFYAGHGGEADAPKGWEAGDAKIQMLIPHDFHDNVDGQVTFGIPDRTIGTLLSRLAEKWGDNIVCSPEPLTI